MGIVKGRPPGLRGYRVLLLGSTLFSTLFLGAACGGGGGDSPGGATDSGSLCIINVDVGLFTYCAEYVGYTESLCTQGRGMFNAQCPAGYVGTCDTVGHVNPRRTYFYGALITPQIVESVCPDGKYVPGTIPGGTAGAGGGTGGHGGSGGGAGSSAGGAGGSGTGNGTCAGLSQCCAATTNPTMKSSCLTEYDLLKASGDSTCGYVLSTFRAAGYCK
jgi:hypothetical protein